MKDHEFPNEFEIIADAEDDYFQLLMEEKAKSDANIIDHIIAQLRLLQPTPANNEAISFLEQEKIITIGGRND